MKKSVFNSKEVIEVVSEISSAWETGYGDKNP